MKLFHGSILVGVISAPSLDDFWEVGDIELLEGAGPYKPLFEFTTNEDNLEKEPPFDEEMFEHWFIEDADGKRRKIGFPAVHDDGEIYWRYLDELS